MKGILPLQIGKDHTKIKFSQKNLKCYFISLCLEACFFMSQHPFKNLNSCLNNKAKRIIFKKYVTISQIVIIKLKTDHCAIKPTIEK